MLHVLPSWEWLCRILETCNRNRTDYSNVLEQLELIKEINREFRKRGIQEEAHMACEYVVELKDEGWRDAIEAFLGIHRYAILVSRESFDVANAVLDQSRHRYVELVNTKRLMARTMECVEDSVFHYLQIQNETAANYFRFWLGRIHAVEKSAVPDYDNAMSKEGKLSRNMAVTYINTGKIRSYCLGSEAVELNRRAAEKRLQELETREKEVLAGQRGLLEQSKYLQAGLAYFKEYNLDAHREAAEVTADLNEERGRYQELLEAQKNNAEFLALNGRVTELWAQLSSKKKLRTENLTQKTILETTVSEKEKSVKILKRTESESRAELEKERLSGNSAVEQAVGEYDGFLAGNNPGGGLMQRETKTRADGGLYAELVQNRSFEFDPIDHAKYDHLTAWEKLETGGEVRLVVETGNPVSDRNPHYLGIDIIHPARGEGEETGVCNNGFNEGIPFTGGGVYYFTCYAKREQSLEAPVTVSLRSRDGQIYASKEIFLTTEWKKYELELTSPVTDYAGRLVIAPGRRGKVYLDFISLFLASFSIAGSDFTYSFPGKSVTVLRFRR